MMLPRYLQLAILATAGAVIWSLFIDDETAAVSARPLSAGQEQPATSVSDRIKTPRTDRINLFTVPVLAKTDDEPPPERESPPPPEPTTPPLPLQALGAWWSNNQRILLLTDGVETWPVCDRCRADGKIWIGSSPINGWTLKAVEKDHLLFEWQLTHIQQRLELGDLQSEPTQ